MPIPSFVIRPFRFEDIDNGWLETQNELKPVGEITRMEIEDIARELSEYPYYIFVAIADGVVVGSITLLLEQKIIRKGGLAAHIEDVIVQREYRGGKEKSIAVALMRKAIEKARELGCYKAILDCDDELVGHYRQSGFQDDGTFMRLRLKNVD